MELPPTAPSVAMIAPAQSSVETPALPSTALLQDVMYDMETNDPDDFFTLCLLASHPRVTLRAVTIIPGTRFQVGVVKHTLRLLKRQDVRVGSFGKNMQAAAVSGFHYDFLGPVPPEDADGAGWEIMAETFRRFPKTSLITGAPLHNAGELLKNAPDVKIPLWVAQGGFAGDSVVPAEHRLQKFTGMETCSTFNFGGSRESALALLASDRVGARRLVSKNVCHSVVYDKAMHEWLRPHRESHAGLKLIFDGMDAYLQKRKGGKMFHDPLAACAAIDPDVVETREVELYTEKGKWGSRLRAGTRTHISVALRRGRFLLVLCGRDGSDQKQAAEAELAYKNMLRTVSDEAEGAAFQRIEQEKALGAEVKKQRSARDAGDHEEEEDGPLAPPPSTT